MIDLDEELTAYARDWRAAQPPVPPLSIEQRSAPRRPSRGAIVAAALVVVLALGAAAFVATRSDHSTPTIDAPPTTRRDVVPDADVPTLDVVPLYLPINAADMYSVGPVSDRITVRPADTGKTPTHAEQVQFNACYVDLAAGSGGATYGYEDPAAWQGAPVAPTVAPPDPPPTAPRCTRSAARAAGQVRKLSEALRWHEQLQAVDADPVISGAIAQDIVCLNERGIDRVASDGYVTDGFNQRHPELIGQSRLAFEQCFPPVVAARAPLREALRESFVADHAGEIENLQRAFDDYLRAVYAPAPHAKTVTTEPDRARFDGGCIRVTDPGSKRPAFNPDQALAIAHGALGDASAPVSRTSLGNATVCDHASIHDRLAWVLQFARNVVVVDAVTGKVVLNRAVTGN